MVGIIVATLFLAGKSQQRDTEQTEKMAEESDQKEATEEKKVEDADNMVDDQKEEIAQKDTEPPIFRNESGIMMEQYIPVMTYSIQTGQAWTGIIMILSLYIKIIFT